MTERELREGLMALKRYYELYDPRYEAYRSFQYMSVEDIQYKLEYTRKELEKAKQWLVGLSSSPIALKTGYVIYIEGLNSVLSIYESFLELYKQCEKEG